MKARSSPSSKTTRMLPEIRITPASGMTIRFTRARTEHRDVLAASRLLAWALSNERGIQGVVQRHRTSTPDRGPFLLSQGFAQDAVQVARNGGAAVFAKTAGQEVGGSAAHDGAERAIASKAVVGVVTLCLVGEPPPEARLYLCPGKHRLDVARADFCGLQRRLGLPGGRALAAGRGPAPSPSRGSDACCRGGATSKGIEAR